MRKLLVLVLAAATIWSGYWVYGSRNLKVEINQWLAQRSEQGWIAEVSNLSVRGFPNRFDTTFDELDITDPNTGISWSAPFFQTLMLSYKPNHIIFAWPETQTFSTPYQKIEILSSELIASVVTSEDLMMLLQRATVTANSIEMNSTAGWVSKLSDINVSIRESSIQNTYEIAGLVNSLTPNQTLVEQLANTLALPQSLTDIQLRATVALTEPLGRKTIDVRRPQVRRINLGQFSASWGLSQLRVTGDVTVDDVGELTGKLIVNARNWEELLEAAEIAGQLSGELKSIIEAGLGLLANLNGSKDSIEVPLTFRSGKIFLGPIPIGKAPNFLIR